MIVLVCTSLGSHLYSQSNEGTFPLTYKSSLLQKLEKADTIQSILITPTFFDYNKAYQKSLGVFCKGENKLSQGAPVNFRLRLGSLDYVNKLEGKSK